MNNIQPIRHSRERGNPPPLPVRLLRKWIPAFAGMTLCVSTALAQTTASPEAFIQQSAAGSKGQKLQQALAAGVLMGCVNKQAGQQATTAFSAKLQAIGKQTSALCKAGQKQAARDTVVAGIDSIEHDPVLPVMQRCYTQNKDNIEALAGGALGGDFARYTEWAMNPEAAKAQLKPEDICK